MRAIRNFQGLPPEIATSAPTNTPGPIPDSRVFFVPATARPALVPATWPAALPYAADSTEHAAPVYLARPVELPANPVEIAIFRCNFIGATD